MRLVLVKLGEGGPWIAERSERRKRSSPLPLKMVQELEPGGGDRHAPTDAERLFRNPQPRRGLATLVFGSGDEFQNPRDRGLVDLGDAIENRPRPQMAVDVQSEDAIKEVVRRQGVLVLLAGTQLRG